MTTKSVDQFIGDLPARWLDEADTLLDLAKTMRAMNADSVADTIEHRANALRECAADLRLSLDGGGSRTVETVEAMRETFAGGSHA